MKFQIEKMQKTHIDDVLDICAHSFATPWSRTSFLNELNNVFANYLVAIHNNKVIGFAGTWIILDESHITNIAVSPNFRKMGVGKKLLEALVNQGISKGVVAFTLEVRESNIAAQNLYSSHGFITEGIRKNYYEDNKENALIMWKRLNS